LAALRQMMAKHKAAGNKSIDVATFKDLADVSRKYAIPLLEFLDRERITRRDGDKRLLL
jgi:selenocysteine-specific elongation factor